MAKKYFVFMYLGKLNVFFMFIFKAINASTSRHWSQMFLSCINNDVINSLRKIPETCNLIYRNAESMISHGEMSRRYLKIDTAQAYINPSFRWLGLPATIVAYDTTYQR